MILDLRRRNHMMVYRGLSCVVSLLLNIAEDTRNSSISFCISILIAFTYEDPFKLFWLLLTSCENRLIVWGVVWVAFIWLGLIFILWIMGGIVNQITYLAQGCSHLVILLLICVYSRTVVPNWELSIIYVLAVILNFTPIFYFLNSLFLVAPIFYTPWSMCFVLLFEFFLRVIIVTF